MNIDTCDLYWIIIEQQKIRYMLLLTLIYIDSFSILSYSIIELSAIF